MRQPARPLWPPQDTPATRRRRRQIWHATLGAMLLAAVCVGCAATVQHAYTGPELPAAEAAVLSGSTHRLITLFYNRSIFIRVEALDDYVADSDTTEWQVPPGEHTVRASYFMQRLFMLGAAFFNYRHLPRTAALTFHAEAGHRYRVDGALPDALRDTPTFCAWIEDEATGAIVAGAKDCGPPPAASAEPSAP